MIVLHLRARDVDALIAQQYDTIRVYRDTSATGPFTNLVGTVTPLVAGQEYYDFVDSTGDLTNYYEFTYYKSFNNSETSKSVAFTAAPTTGPLGVLTIDWVRNTTDIPAVANLPASKVAELIVRAETELLNYANRFGKGLNQAISNYATVMPIIARTVLEEIYLHMRPANRARLAGNLASERIGSYSYTTRGGATTAADASFWTAEILNLLTPFLLGRRLDTSVKTTNVFQELNPTETPLSHQQDGVAVSPWNDLYDVDFLRTFPTAYVNLSMGQTGNIIGTAAQDWWDI